MAPWLATLSALNRSCVALERHVDSATRSKVFASPSRHRKPAIIGRMTFAALRHRAKSCCEGACQRKHLALPS